VIVKVGIEAKPWEVPTYIVLHKDNSPIMTIDLKDTDVATLDAMCVQFRQQVFVKAGKADPRVTQR